MAATNLNTVRSTIESRLKDELETGTPPITVVFNIENNCYRWRSCFKLIFQTAFNRRTNSI